mgnify:CR=1 FL=1
MLKKILPYTVFILIILLLSAMIYTLNQEVYYLQKVIGKYRSEVKSLNNKVVVLNQSFYTLKNLVESYKNLTAVMEKEVSILRSILNLSISMPLLDTNLILKPYVNVTYNFNVKYPGYINASIGYVDEEVIIMVIGSYNGSTYIFRAKFTAKNIIIPVLPGSVEIYIHNSGLQDKYVHLTLLLVY